MPKFRCSSCNFEFSPRTWDIKNKCPYCAKEGTLTTEDNPSIEDVDSFLR